MKTKFYRFAFIGLIAAAFSVPAFSQDRGSGAASERYVISAKAGGVNFIEGSVSVVRKTGRSGLLLRNDSLNAGDRVSTGADGKAEILLNPGSYVRMGGNSSFEFRTTELSDLNLAVHSGSVIFEVFASNDFAVNVHGPKSKFVLVDSGIYRLDVEGDESKLSVWKGKARVGGESGEIMKGGRESTVAGGEVLVAKFDRDEKDDLDTWSKARSKELSRMIASLDSNNVRNSLMYSYLGGRWNMYNSFGLWVYDPFRSSYCFLPFGYGWSSPYGYGYRRYIGWYQLPPVVYYPPTVPGGGGTPPTRGATPPFSQGPVDSRRGGRVSTSESRPDPPFSRMQRQEGRSSFPTQNTESDFPRPSSRGSGPVFVPRAPSTPATNDSGGVTGGNPTRRRP